MNIDYNSINEAVLRNDFTAFNQLNDEDRVEVMKTWTEKMWCNYYTKDEMSLDDTFNELLKIVDATT